MATLALSFVGQMAGAAIGGPFGATIGRALGALAGSVIDNQLFGEKPQTTGVDVRVQGSSEGVPIPRLYGWSRLSGNIIWATELEEIDVEASGAKGGGASERGIAASFAIGLCEGEVHRLGRIWADGQLLELSDVTMRFYRGTEAQTADSLIEAKQGENAPAYRGLCYLVFERLPLAQFGNRIPNISVELCRVVGELEPSIRAVTMIPGATEFGYDPVARLRLVGGGLTLSENAHALRDESDWTVSVDELTALCPNLEHVALVIAWFGDDLRCGECTVRPRVEASSRSIEGTSWGVAGYTRGTAQVVSQVDGGPAYGGTPSDNAVKAVIADLKARGIGVTLYPIIMMDIAPDNPMGQPAYPWRGRIACAAGDDGTGAATSQVAAFADEYRDFILHYAGLTEDAGGVDALIIGSELRGLTQTRGTANSFPFVEALVDLAADVRAVVGSGTTLTYAADWSEFAGHQPGGGAKFFHLDPLWASDDIDVIGIDNYMPLADTREGVVRMRRTRCRSRAARGSTGTTPMMRRGSRARAARSPMGRMASRGCGGSRISPAGGARRTTTGRAARAMCHRPRGRRRANRSGSPNWDAVRSIAGRTSRMCFSIPRAARALRRISRTGLRMRCSSGRCCARISTIGPGARWSSASICGPGMRGPIRRFRRSGMCGAMARTTKPGTGSQAGSARWRAMSWRGRWQQIMV